jgi:hypothetical protein
MGENSKFLLNLVEALQQVSSMIVLWYCSHWYIWYCHSLSVLPFICSLDIVLIGKIGGTAEEDVAGFIKVLFSRGNYGRAAACQSVPIKGFFTSHPSCVMSIYGDCV